MTEQLYNSINEKEERGSNIRKLHMVLGENTVSAVFSLAQGSTRASSFHGTKSKTSFIVVE